MQQKSRYYVILFFLFQTTLLLGQETIFTDRPNVTDAVALLKPGTFQVEVGYLNQKFDDNGSDFHFNTIPNLNVKYGLHERVELRILTNYNQVNIKGGSDITGFSPVTFSPKVHITDQQNLLPSLTFVSSFTFPDLGDPEFQTDKLNYGIRLLTEYQLHDNIAWTNSFGSDWGDDRKAVWAYTSVVGISLSNRFGAFAEVYGNIADHIDSVHGVDTGISYLLSNDIQADALIGFPINDHAADLLFGFGLAWKTHFID